MYGFTYYRDLKRVFGDLEKTKEQEASDEGIFSNMSNSLQHKMNEKLKHLAMEGERAKLPIVPCVIINKFAKRDYTQPKVTTHGTNNTNKNILDILAMHNINKLHLA